MYYGQKPLHGLSQRQTTGRTAHHRPDPGSRFWQRRKAEVVVVVAAAAALLSPAGRGEAAVEAHLSGCPALPGRAAGESRAKPWKCSRSCLWEEVVAGGLEQDKKQAHKHRLHQGLFLQWQSHCPCPTASHQHTGEGGLVWDPRPWGGIALSTPFPALQSSLGSWCWCEEQRSGEQGTSKHKHSSVPIFPSPSATEASAEVLLVLVATFKPLQVTLATSNISYSWNSRYCGGPSHSPLPSHVPLQGKKTRSRRALLPSKALCPLGWSAPGVTARVCGGAQGNSAQEQQRQAAWPQLAHL